MDPSNPPISSWAPRVSVVMSVYNGERRVREAVESVLAQTFTDFELILINDGSTDGTWPILRSFTDPRVILIDHDDNAGLAARLKEGVERARGELIARMDADDISLPGRFAKQVAFLDAHPEVGVLGTAMQQTDDARRPLTIIVPPANHAMIAWTMLFESAIMHATVMMRRAAVLQAGNYDPQYIHVEDTELWNRMASITKFANLPEPLYIRQWLKDSISGRYPQFQRQRSAEIRSRLLQNLLGKNLPDGISQPYVRVLSSPTAVLSKPAIDQISALLIGANQKIANDNQLPPGSDVARQLQEGLTQQLKMIRQHGRLRIASLSYRWLKSRMPYAVKNWVNRQLAGRRFRD